MARRPVANPDAPHVLIVGGGYVGLYTALRLQKKLKSELKRGDVKVTIVDPQSYMTYQPFLPEAAAGNLSPRHVVVPLRRVLPKVDIVTARVTELSHAERWAIIQPVEGPPQRISYDYLVMAAGSVSRTLPIPGLAEHGIGFKTIGEAIHLRNHVLAQLDIAASTDDEDVRKRALTFVVVGGGFAGIEALAEMEDMARDAIRMYSNLRAADMRWVMVEASDRILPEVGPELGRWTAEQLRGRGIEVKLKTFLTSAVDKQIELSDGESFPTNTLVWTAGAKANPVAKSTDLPVDERGRVKGNEFLQIEGTVRAFTAGDNAAIPDLTKEGEFCAPNAQHAVRQSKVLADNLVAALRGKALKPYRHAYVGSVAGLGLHKGVAHVYGVKLRGLAAWFMHRTYHLSRVPTFNRKVRVVADWTLALFFKRETISLGSIEQPREEFVLAAASDRPVETDVVKSAAK
ncbi:NAD(P)/FAD-dependent oxidoreductase [Actinocorallia populi]|uniref:NAD(P)/FAD-dependent oxidoreductase n=1 Tax=Actinocorallia populi TaxID=2079200 RepID=UPI000D08AA15|nr:NAD(P)/FAD-dependent oxidoreductase [Actinocorallia populi]